MLPLGIYAWFGYDLPLEKRLELIAEAGFTATCLWFGHEEAMIREGRADDMPTLVREYGLTLDNIHAPFWHSSYLWSEFKNEQTTIRVELSNSLLFCHRHHIPIMVMHVSAGKTPPPLNQTGLQIIRDLVRQAENQGITIALENAEDYGNHFLDFVFSNIQSPNLGFCYDSSHDAIAKEFNGKALEKWGSLLAATHFSDNNGVNDDHLLPGSGSIDWHAVMSQFPKDRYKGSLMLEVDGPEANKGYTVEKFVKTAYLKAQELAAMLE